MHIIRLILMRGVLSTGVCPTADAAQITIARNFSGLAAGAVKG